MSPADGADFHHADAGATVALTVTRAILLHGGQTLALFEGAPSAPPAAGALVGQTVRSGWTALAWQGPGGWSGVACLAAVPAAGDQVVSADDCWRIGTAPALDIAAEPLADLVRRTGGSAPQVLRFLAALLLADGAPEAAAQRGFLAGFVAAVAEPDGFVEIVGRPTTGGLFAQGWSMSLDAGATGLVALDQDLAATEAQVALFGRDDILPPSRGFCLYAKGWPGDAGLGLEALHHERDGRLLRLDVVRGASAQSGEPATRHVAEMLPRLEAPRPAIDAFRRICRPRFAGVDTLSGTALPIAAALDVLLQAPDGALLALGWLLDPERRVEIAALKSSANLYARLDASWCPLPRADLVSGFAADPRFAGRLAPREVMHGFVACLPAERARVDAAELYLELVLDDGSCLFRPLAASRFETGEALPQLLALLPQTGPELSMIVEDHLAPFLASVPPVSPRARRGGAGRPFPLGAATTGRGVAAVIPFRAWAELQPMLALLAGTPEASALEIVLVAARDTAADCIARLEAAFGFYGLAGRLVVAGDGDALPARLDLGVAASAAPRILAWTPAALPKAPGWLARLEAEAAGVPTAGLISPALTYEDGSIAFGGAGSARAGACSLAGLGAVRLPRGAPRPAPTGAAAIALVDRATLVRVGGFAGRLFGETHAHVDLAARLAATGFASWCSGAVEFWALEDAGPEADSALVRRIDAALLARRALAPAQAESEETAA